MGCVSAARCVETATCQKLGGVRLRASCRDPTAAPMRWSQAFLPVLKESPADAQIISHKLMLRAGLVRQTAAGIYAWLPLGFRVLKKIEQIVRKNRIVPALRKC